MVKAAKTIERNWEGVVRWFHSGISNSLLAATNGLIQSAKRRARGNRSIKNLFIMIYMIAGKLDLKLPQLRVAFARTK